ncbi:hypothetical protein [Kitasatospora sp. NPDC057936]|uniref:hypothetical protein n=1 Tax=Kitasatospora sp. NPDC057936 TaxID=3346283 RepID=UPI0036DF5AE9
MHRQKGTPELLSGSVPAAIPVVLISVSTTAAAAYAIKKLSQNPARLAVVISAIVALVSALPPVIKAFNETPPPMANVTTVVGWQSPAAGGISEACHFRTISCPSEDTPPDGAVAS